MQTSVTESNPAGKPRHFSNSLTDSGLVRNSGRDSALVLSLAGDCVAVLLGLLLGYWLRFHSGIIPLQITGLTEPFDPSTISLSSYSRLIALGGVLLIGTFLYSGLYSVRNIMRFRRSAMTIVRGSIFWFVAYLSFSLVVKFQPSISRMYVLSSLVSTVSILLLWRLMFHRILRAESFARVLRQNIVLVGWNNEVANLADAIESDASHPYRLIGVVEPPSASFKVPPPPGVPRLGSFDNLSELIRNHRADMVVLGDLDIQSDRILEVANHCEREMVQFKIVPNYFQILVSGLQLETISGIPIMGVTELPLDRLVNRILKRTVDIAGALVGLFLSAPLIAVFGTMVYLESPGPIFYFQTRTGRNGRNFRIIKLRSMRLDAEVAGAQWAKEGDPRRLKVGALMRSTNIDEVPQFWNVLKGEMSLVGPRPERPELIANFQYDIPHYNARLASKPGMTGWAQVNGLRGNTSLVERVRADLYYLENWSLWLDFQIMAQTFFRRKNAY
jgi:exopolysaccharide biosynthesis polyprenyl glycosylphosphotransferase